MSGRLPAACGAGGFGRRQCWGGRGPPGRGTVVVSTGGFLTFGLEGSIRKHRIRAGAQYPRFGDLKSLLGNNCHPPPEPFLLRE